MTNPYEELRAECYKRLYPNGIPLEFGCEVWDWEKGVVRLVRKDVYTTWTTECGRGVEPVELENICKILGKPLELPDVLRAMKKIAPEKGDDFPIGFDYHGRISNCDVDCKNLTQTDIGLNLAVPLSHPDNSVACDKLLALLTNK